MKEVTQQQRLAIIVDLFTKQLPRRRYTRLILTDLLMGFEPGTVHSSNDLSEDQITTLLDSRFPEWREQFIDPNDHPQLFELAQQANNLVNTIYPHKEPTPPTPEDIERKRQRNHEKLLAYKARRKEKQHLAYLKREAKRQANRIAEKKEQTQTKHVQTETYQNQMDNDRLTRLNEWRAKAGLPPVEEL